MDIQTKQAIDRAIRLHEATHHKETVKSKGFIKPTVEELREYADSIKFYAFDPQKFLAHYESNGWMVGNVKMKDWRAAVRTWYHGSPENKKQVLRQETPLRQVVCIVDHEPAQHYSNNKQGKPTWLCYKCADAFEKQTGHRNWGLMSASQIEKIVLQGKAIKL